MVFFVNVTAEMPDPAYALPGRSEPVPTAATHFVNGAPLKGPSPVGSEVAIFGLGCFWGTEKVFWQLDGVIVTAAGYIGGYTPNPTFEEVCTGQTGHSEVVKIVFDPKKIGYAELLKVFWQGHNPEQEIAKGKEVGTQYRSGIYTLSDEQARQARASKAAFQSALILAHHPMVTTEILPAGEFYYAEEYQQQYIAKNPGGHCALCGSSVSCQVALRG